jgi:hypothetical protein
MRDPVKVGEVATITLVAALSVTGIVALHVINHRTNAVTYTYASATEDVAVVRVQAERLLEASRKYVLSGADRDRARVRDAVSMMNAALARMQVRDTAVSAERAAVARDVGGYVDQFTKLEHDRSGMSNPDALLGAFERSADDDTA